MRRGLFLPIVATLGFVFLYAPIVSLVVFSFNESKLVTVWGGFSTKWYVELFANPDVLNAGLLSLRIAASSATIALVLGTLCAVALGLCERLFHLCQLLVIVLKLPGRLAHFRTSSVDGISMHCNLSRFRKGCREERGDVTDWWLQPSGRLIKIGLDAPYLRFQPIKTGQRGEIAAQRLQLIAIGSRIDQPARKAIPLQSGQLLALALGLLG